MTASWFKALLIAALLLVSSGGNAHASADHAVAKAEPCASHQHHEHPKPAANHQDCCCTCFSCPAGLVTPMQPDARHPVAYHLHLAPERAAPLASRSLSPELDPPRPSALS